MKFHSLSLKEKIKNALRSDNCDKLSVALTECLEIMGDTHDGGTMWELRQCLVCGNSANVDKNEKLNHDKDCPAKLGWSRYDEEH